METNCCWFFSFFFDNILIVTRYFLTGTSARGRWSSRGRRTRPSAPRKGRFPPVYPCLFTARHLLWIRFLNHSSVTGSQSPRAQPLTLVIAHERSRARKRTPARAYRRSSEPEDSDPLDPLLLKVAAHAPFLPLSHPVRAFRLVALPAMSDHVASRLMTEGLVD